MMRVYDESGKVNPAELDAVLKYYRGVSISEVDELPDTSVTYRWDVMWGPKPGWRNTLRVYRDRIRDAWLVLRGKAWIGDD